MLKLIAISGKRESGKTTLANFLKEYGYQKVSLADPLKRMCMGLYNLQPEQVFGPFKESPTHYKRTDGTFYTPRDILIREGCLKRSIDPDFWTKKLAMEIMNAEDGGDKFVVDDIRFLNEISYLKKHFPGARFVRIERSEDAIGKAALDDLSETELDHYKEWDALLLPEFNKTPDDLKSFAEYIECKMR